METTTDNLSTLNITRQLPASKEKLFELWTNPALLKTWITPGNFYIPYVDVDLRIDGRYRIVLEDSEGTQHIANGIFKNIKKPDSLAFSWIWTNPDANFTQTLVSVDFKKTLDGTECHLIHEQIESRILRDSHERGWNRCLKKLELVI